MMATKQYNLSYLVALSLPLALSQMVTAVNAQEVSGFGKGATNQSACSQAIAAASVWCDSRTLRSIGQCYCTHSSDIRDRQCDVVAICEPLSPEQIERRERAEYNRNLQAKNIQFVRKSLGRLPVLPVEMQENVEAILRAESRTWFFNTYDPLSASGFEFGSQLEEMGSRPFVWVDYTYNDGRRGHVVVMINSDFDLCLNFWDTTASACEAVTKSAEASADLLRAFLLDP